MALLPALLLALALGPAFGQAVLTMGAAELLARRAAVVALLAQERAPSETAALQDELALIDRLLAGPERAGALPPAVVSHGAGGRSELAAPADQLFDGRKPRLPGYGLLPSENTGALAPAMRTESASVLSAGKSAFALQGDAANYLTDQGFSRWVYQKFERQTVSLEYRRGLKTELFPALELGLRVDARRRRLGALNGFISGWEHGLAWLAQNKDFINDDRGGEYGYSGTGESIGLDGKVLRQDDGRSRYRVSDAQLVLKAALLRSSPGRFVPDVALRFVANVSNPKSLDSDGDFVGAGASVSQPVGRRTTLHADARVLKPKGERDALGLELKNFAFGGTLGVERRIDCGKVKDLSFGLQFNHNQSPHKPVGQVAIDGSRSDVTLGFSYLAKISGQQVLFQLYGREDINFSGGGGGYLTPYSPPDFQAGLRAAWMLE